MASTVVGNGIDCSKWKQPFTKEKLAEPKPIVELHTFYESYWLSVAVYLLETICRLPYNSNLQLSIMSVQPNWLQYFFPTDYISLDKHLIFNFFDTVFHRKPCFPGPLEEWRCLKENQNLCKFQLLIVRQ